MTLYFHNPGTLPIEAAITMGVNAKADSSAIGQFGTGLKFSIAGILRLGGTIAITTGGETYRFYSAPITIRDKEFHIVCMSTDSYPTGQNLGFTTSLGAHWEPWMLYRELWSNARDEGGTAGSEAPEESSASTIIRVDCKELETIHREKESYFVEPWAEVLWEAAGVQVLAKQESAGEAIFYRGIRAGRLPKEALYTYNILSEQRLTEDRTLGDFNAEWAIRRALVQAPERWQSESIVLAKKRLWEESQDFDYTSDWSQSFREAVRRSGKQGKHHRSAKRLYSEDYEPQRKPMTALREAELLELQAKFPAGTLPWKEVSLADLEGEDYEFTRSGKELLIGEGLTGRELQKLLTKVWHTYADEKALLEAFFGSDSLDSEEEQEESEF